MTEPLSATLIEQLAAIVGASQVSTDPDVLSGRAVDHTGRYRGRAGALVRPGTADEVAAVLRACRDAGVFVTVQGGRTSLVVAGRVPERVAAAMSFHGGGLASDDPGSPHLLADQIRAAVYVGAARNDRSFTTENGETLEKALTAAGVDHTIEWYPAEHGFAVPDNGPYDEAAAARHWEAMESFFGAHLH